MDIKDKISPEDKQEMANLVIVSQVLGNLLKERDTMIRNKVGEILAKEGFSPDIYDLKFNLGQNSWEAILKAGALIIPNRETRRAMERGQN